MLLQKLRGLFGSSNGGVEQLKMALQEPRQTVDLYGIFEEPRLDTQGANTAVFPVTLYDTETGDKYGDTKLEFDIETDQGQAALNAMLDAYNIGGREQLHEIIGLEAEIERKPSGNVRVSW